ncbi:SGNH/GDSL hydrolase family protein [Enterococcus timonensis]|uniref:SGNH/GDSL hydrolase family protein n=1 Tax=Enterococcus timonensis TaxID=1852364 RepID=UPI0008D9E125|nr:SGNH/GDSL hydrolase family protein [Enterococcus timonensis]
MKVWQKIISYTVVILIGFVASFFIFSLFLQPKEGVLVNAQPVRKEDSKSAVSLVALGDSLTQGIGDTTNRGGFVPLAVSDVKNYFDLAAFDADNFGKSGDRSDQVLKRLTESTEQQDALKKADIVTLTVGGNDLMSTIKKELFNKISLDTFEKPAAKYQTNLKNLLAEIRKYAPDAPIYLFGIYNPFYVYFPQITELQDVVSFWNEQSEKIIADTKRSYFIPINDLLYNGSDGATVVAESDTTSTQEENTTQNSSNQSDSSQDSSEIADATTDSTISDEELAGLVEAVNNDLIFEEDHFHPNNLGYQKMATALRDQLISTQGLWLKEGQTSGE